MTRWITTVLLPVGFLVLLAPPAHADPDFDNQHSESGTNILGHDGQSGSQDSSESGSTPAETYVPGGPPAPVYEDYYTPACSANGPPTGGSADALCGAAVRTCDIRGEEGDLFMQHWRRQVSPQQGRWEFVGNECRGADEPTEEEPEPTPEMVLDQAFAAAPHPTAHVQPGTRSFVNVPNNYYAEAAGDTVTVNVLGNPIAVTFTVNEITWDFGDGSSATGEGVQDASVGDPAAVEHAYARQGQYAITASTTVGVQFTLPDGQQVNEPDAFSFSSDPVELPVGEIQTRVDSTN